MPISEPSKARSIAPDSLAFERSPLGISGVSIQQQQAEFNVTNNFITQGVDDNYLRRIMEQDKRSIDGERRAKNWVGDFNAAFDWDIDTDVSITNNTYQPIDFDNEVIKCDGVYNRGGVWFFRVPEKYAGAWWLHARIQVQLPPLATVTRAQLGFSIGNTSPVVTLVDDINQAWTGSTPMLNALLSGGRILRLRGGDLLMCVIRIVGAAGSTSYIHPSSVVGYISGHRVTCETEITNSPDNQTGYTFGV